jgi:mono/diheme cytochrome c family protein
MTRIRAALLIPAAIAVAMTTLAAGGWAVITLDELPERIEAGRAVPLTFIVRQHGVSPMKGLHPRIEASSGQLKASADATPTAREGQYAASLTLPQAGEWSITIHSGFMTSKLTLLPIAVSSAGSPTAAGAPALERGRQLFVAKGCATCHTQEGVQADQSLNVGPPILAQKYRDEFLARVLADPSVLPPGRSPNVKMPNLDLRSQEISALVAFINHGTNGGSR